MAQEIIVRDGTSPDSSNPAAVVDSTGALKVSGGTAGSGSATVLAVSSGDTAAVTTLNAATTGNGTTVDFGTFRRTVAMYVMANGTVTGGTVRLQVSADGTNFANFPIDVITGTIVTGQYLIQVSPDGAYRYARAAVVSAITGGGSVTVSLASNG